MMHGTDASKGDGMRKESTITAKNPGMLTLTLNGIATDVDATTIAELVATLGLEGKRIAVEKNGDIVPRSRYASTSLVRGDRLEIVGAVGGG